MKKNLLGFLLIAAGMAMIPAFSQDRLGELAIDQLATDTIRAATTDEDYLTRWVDSMPEHPTVPSPRDVLGYTIGTPGELTQVDDIYTYFEALAAASDRVEIFQLGQSFEQRDMLIVAIAEPEHLANIDTYKSYLASLSDPRITDRQAAETISASAIVTFSSSGATTLRAARERPNVSIMGLTPNKATYRQMALAWGVHSLMTADLTSFSEMVNIAVDAARHEEFAGPGDTVVVTAGVPFGTPGATNILRIAVVE